MWTAVIRSRSKPDVEFNMADVFANSMAYHPRSTCHIAGWCHLANLMSWSQSYVSHCRVLPPGEFNGMSSQSHVSHCSTWWIHCHDSSHATLQGTVTWRNQCHDCVTLQGVKISSAILIIVFAIFYFLMQLGALTSGGFRIVFDTLSLLLVSLLLSLYVVNSDTCKGVFIATQFNSIQLDVELSCVAIDGCL